MQNLLEAQQQARKAEQLASTGVVLPAAEMPGTTAVGAVGGDSDSYGDRVLTAAATTAVDTEKGPSPEAIRVEEIQAELKATAIAKKKVDCAKNRKHLHLQFFIQFYTQMAVKYVRNRLSTVSAYIASYHCTPTAQGAKYYT